MLNLLPTRGSKKWLVWFAVYGLVLSVIFWIDRFAVLGQSFEWNIALRFMLLAYILAFIVNLCGWLGGRWVWLFTGVGIVGGLIIMFYYSIDMTGWEDLVSILAFGEAAVIGFALGLLVEAGVAIRNWSRVRR